MNEPGATSGAFWYLIRRSARNRLRRQGARLRQPRYAAAFALGLLYFWFFFLRSNRSGALGPEAQGALLGLFGVLVLSYLAWSWLFGTDRTALAFTRAEVALLFPAPVTRRQLILFKLARTQFGILFSVVIWSVILNRAGDPLASLMRGAGLWMALTTLSLHRLGIGLLRAGVEEHGAAGARRSVPAMVVFAAASLAVGWTIRSHWDWVSNAEEPAAAIRALLAIVDLPPASWILYPIKVAFQPVVLRDVGPWFAAAAQAMLLLSLHVWWVLGSDAAFEEAAAEASERQAKWIAQRRARRGGGAMVKAGSTRRTIPLGAKGAPATAIVWKNILWLVRTNQLRGILIPPALILIATLVFGTRDKMGLMFGVVSGVFAAMFLLFGPATMRNDLRSDLLNLPMLKTLPIPGRALVTAQVLSGAIAIAVPQLLLVGNAFVALTLEPGASRVPPDVMLGVLLGSVPLLFALNAANFTVHNGVALLFPAWVKLGERGTTGIEATGQMMMTTLATLLSLAVLLLLPAITGAIGFLIFRSTNGTAILVAASAAGLVLAGETWLMLGALGTAFEKVEPTQVAN